MKNEGKREKDREGERKGERKIEILKRHERQIERKDL